jgi:hypothetical protein
MNELAIKELKEGLSKMTNILNNRRGLYNKYIAGQRYILDTSEPNKFLILTQYHKKGNRGICAEITIDDKGLEGLITPMKSAKPVVDFLHSFSHKHNVSLGYLSHALSFNYYS